MASGMIFINYRKEDSNWNSLALYNELRKYFPPGLLFKDLNTIEPGDDFEQSIKEALISCEILLVIIGKDWLSMTDKKGNPRLFDPNDFVRLEISTALAEKKRVIPVLFDGTKLPAMEELPDDLRPLCKRQYYEISKERFDYDVKVLSDFISKVLKLQKVGATQPPEPAIPVRNKAIVQDKEKNKMASYAEKKPAKLNFMYVIAGFFIIIWLIGFLGYSSAGLIHILLVIAIVCFIIALVARSK